MNPDKFRALYAFTDWANDRVLSQAARLSEDDYRRDFGHAWGSVHDTLAHICGADFIWLSRWQGTSPDAVPGGESFSTLADLRSAWEGVMAERRAFVEGLDDKSLLRVVEYRTTKGVSHAEPLWQLMLHVANHSTDHRSQVATLLTQLGHPPQALDMIAYFRLNE